jgi:hypothetical protein
MTDIGKEQGQDQNKHEKHGVGNREGERGWEGSRRGVFF